MVTQDIQVAIVGADFKEVVVRAVPLIEHFLNQILTLAQLKPHRPLVRPSAGIALYSHDHLFKSGARCRRRHDSYDALSAAKSVVRRFFRLSKIDSGKRASFVKQHPHKSPHNLRIGLNSRGAKGV